MVDFPLPRQCHRLLLLFLLSLFFCSAIHSSLVGYFFTTVLVSFLRRFFGLYFGAFLLGYFAKNFVSKCCCSSTISWDSWNSFGKTEFARNQIMVQGYLQLCAPDLHWIHIVSKPAIINYSSGLLFINHYTSLLLTNDSC